MSTNASQRRALKEERKSEALALRVAGYNFKYIGKQVGVSTTMAFKYVNEALKESREKTGISGDKLRELELTRLDQLYLQCHKIIMNSNKETIVLSASDKLIKIMERRAKLTGLDDIIESVDDGLIDESYL